MVEKVVGATGCLLPPRFYSSGYHAVHGTNRAETEQCRGPRDPVRHSKKVEQGRLPGDLEISEDGVAIGVSVEVLPSKSVGLGQAGQASAMHSISKSNSIGQD